MNRNEINKHHLREKKLKTYKTLFSLEETFSLGKYLVFQMLGPVSLSNKLTFL